MATIQIKHRFSDAVLFTCELPEDIAALSASRQLGYAVKEALKAGINLRGSDLRDSDLRDSDLSGSDLRDSDLRYSYLRGSNLSGSDLSGSDLRGSDLRDSDLSDSDLSGSDLRYSDLSGSNLSGSDLSGSDLSGAIGAPANLSEATAETTEQRRTREAKRAAQFRERFPDVPVVPQIDAQILAAIEARPDALDMRGWHGTDDASPACETTHCRAGFAVHLAGDAGYALEKKFDAAYAGRLIYMCSVGYTPDFYTDNETALADIRARAAEQVRA